MLQIKDLSIKNLWSIINDNPIKSPQYLFQYPLFYSYNKVEQSKFNYLHQGPYYYHNEDDVSGKNAKLPSMDKIEKLIEHLLAFSDAVKQERGYMFLNQLFSVHVARGRVWDLMFKLSLLQDDLVEIDLYGDKEDRWSSFKWMRHNHPNKEPEQQQSQLQQNSSWMFSLFKANLYNVLTDMVQIPKVLTTVSHWICYLSIIAKLYELTKIERNQRSDFPSPLRKGMFPSLNEENKALQAGIFNWCLKYEPRLLSWLLVGEFPITLAQTQVLLARETLPRTTTAATAATTYWGYNADASNIPLPCILSSRSPCIKDGSLLPYLLQSSDVEGMKMVMKISSYDFDYSYGCILIFNPLVRFLCTLPVDTCEQIKLASHYFKIVESAFVCPQSRKLSFWERVSKAIHKGTKKPAQLQQKVHILVQTKTKLSPEHILGRKPFRIGMCAIRPIGLINIVKKNDSEW